MSRPVPTRPSMLVLACGAIARELTEVIAALPGADVTLQCLPGILHNRPEQIGPAVRERLERSAAAYDTVLVGYADCGTGGGLDTVIAEWSNVERIPGAHCYEFFAGRDRFADANDPFTFYLTDYLARHFDLFVWRGLGLDRWPALRDQYFGNYRRLVYLSQAPTPELLESSRLAADRLGLQFEHVHTGLEELEAVVSSTLGRSEQKIGGPR